MAAIINFPKNFQSRDSEIDPSRLRRLPPTLLAPSAEDVSYAIANEHTSEPIKSVDEIDRVTEYLQTTGRWRDNMLFVVGINFGLRVSDLLTLRFSHLINDDLTFRTEFPILEKKTSKTRKVPKNRYITVNEAVVDAVTLYLEHTKGCKLSDYMFQNESKNKVSENQPMTRKSVDRILKGIGDDLGLQNRMATHTLRKTFAYHQMVMSGNDPRKLLLLQKMFGHSTSAQTLDYIGITNEEITKAYEQLNLGSNKCYAAFGKLEEVKIG